MADLEWNLTGFDEAAKRIMALPDKVRRKIGRQALGAGARIVTNKAKENASRNDDPATGRKIASNIVQRFRSRYFRQTGDIMISIGVATERGPIPKGNPDEGPRGNTPHWHLIEFGTEHSAAEPFLRPALEATASAATDRTANRLEKLLDKVELE